MLLQPQIWSRRSSPVWSSAAPLDSLPTSSSTRRRGRSSSSLHQVWTGPAIVLTLYGWALLLKAVDRLRHRPQPRHAVAEAWRGTGDNAFQYRGGVVLLGVGVACGLALAGVWHAGHVNGLLRTR